MIGFLIKKTFFDLWDNMMRIVLLNLGFIVSLAVPVFLPGVIPIPVLSVAALAAGVLWCCVYLSAAAISLKAVSDYGIFGFADFWANLKAGWPAGIALGTISIFLFVMAGIIIPFYLGMGSIAGLVLAAIIFWTLLLALLSFQFFLAIRARLDTKLKKICRKCFIIFFDNPAFAFFSLLYALVTLVLSLILSVLLPRLGGIFLFFAFFIPGPAGALLFLDEALRLRLLKYDWLEASPQTEGEPMNRGAGPSAPAAHPSKRRGIPWDAILIEEREKTGNRSLRNFIFPWKD